MIFKKYFFLFLFAAFLTSCKKNYQCECTNTFSTYDAGDPVTARSKRSANKQCGQLSSSSTTCKAK